MVTKNPRINITLDDSLAGLLAHLAEQEHQSVASVARALIIEALERREDRILSTLAATRDTENASRIEHKDAW